MKKMNNKGFSLVELIIVIAIMAILAGALAPALISYVAKSRRSTTVSNAQTIASGIQSAISDEAVMDSAEKLFTTTATNITGFSDVPAGDFKKFAQGSLSPQGNTDFYDKVNENVSGGVAAYAKLKATKTSKKGTNSNYTNQPIVSSDGYYVFVDCASSSIFIAINIGSASAPTLVEVYPNADDCMTK